MVRTSWRECPSCPHQAWHSLSSRWQRSAETSRCRAWCLAHSRSSVSGCRCAWSSSWWEPARCRQSASSVSGSVGKHGNRIQTKGTAHCSLLWAHNILRVAWPNCPRACLAWIKLVLSNWAVLGRRWPEVFSLPSPNTLIAQRGGPADMGKTRPWRVPPSSASVPCSHSPFSMIPCPSGLDAHAGPCPPPHTDPTQVLVGPALNSVPTQPAACIPEQERRSLCSGIAAGSLPAPGPTRLEPAGLLCLFVHHGERGVGHHSLPSSREGEGERSPKGLCSEGWLVLSLQPLPEQWSRPLHSSHSLLSKL